MFWYLGQLTFSHYVPDEEQSGSRQRAFDRQVLLFSPDYYDKHGIPQHHAEYQSFQEHVDTVLGEIHENSLPRDTFYIFEHSISLENLFDSTFDNYKEQYLRVYGDTYAGWTYDRLAHMNCRDQVKLPDNNWEYCFKDDNQMSYATTEDYLALRCSVFEDSFQYIQHLAAHDPQIHVMTCDDLYDISRPQADQPVSAWQLDRAASFILSNIYQDMTGSRLPAYIRLENTVPGGQVTSVEYYHLAETYKLLADALCIYFRTGMLPLQCMTKNVIAPTTLESDLPMLQGITLFAPNQVIQAAVQLDLTDPLAASNLWPVPIAPAESYMVPSTNTVGTHHVNAAEMLYLMAQTYHNLYTGAPENIAGIPLHVLNEWAYLIEKEDGGYLATRNPAIYIDPAPVEGAPSHYYFNFLQLWTFKPVQMIDTL